MYIENLDVVLLYYFDLKRYVIFNIENLTLTLNLTSKNLKNLLLSS